MESRSYDKSLDLPRLREIDWSLIETLADLLWEEQPVGANIEIRAVDSQGSYERAEVRQVRDLAEGQDEAPHTIRITVSGTEATMTPRYFHVSVSTSGSPDWAGFRLITSDRKLFNRLRRRIEALVNESEYVEPPASGAPAVGTSDGPPALATGARPPARVGAGPAPTRVSQWINRRRFGSHGRRRRTRAHSRRLNAINAREPG